VRYLKIFQTDHAKGEKGKEKGMKASPGEIQFSYGNLGTVLKVQVELSSTTTSRGWDTTTVPSAIYCPKNSSKLQFQKGHNIHFRLYTNVASSTISPLLLLKKFSPPFYFRVIIVCISFKTSRLSVFPGY
jgi:hypothetical protein